MKSLPAISARLSISAVAWIRSFPDANVLAAPALQRLDVNVNFEVVEKTRRQRFLRTSCRPRIRLSGLTSLFLGYAERERLDALYAGRGSSRWASASIGLVGDLAASSAADGSAGSREQVPQDDRLPGADDAMLGDDHGRRALWL